MYTYRACGPSVLFEEALSYTRYATNHMWDGRMISYIAQSLRLLRKICDLEHPAVPRSGELPGVHDQSGELKTRSPVIYRSAPQKRVDHYWRSIYLILFLSRISRDFCEFIMRAEGKGSGAQKDVKPYHTRVVSSGCRRAGSRPVSIETPIVCASN